MVAFESLPRLPKRHCRDKRVGPPSRRVLAARRLADPTAGTFTTERRKVRSSRVLPTRSADKSSGPGATPASKAITARRRFQPVMTDHAGISSVGSYGASRFGYPRAVQNSGRAVCCRAIARGIGAQPAVSPMLHFHRSLTHTSCLRRILAGEPEAGRISGTALKRSAVTRVDALPSALGRGHGLWAGRPALPQTACARGR